MKRILAQKNLKNHIEFNSSFISFGVANTQKYLTM